MLLAQIIKFIKGELDDLIAFKKLCTDYPVVVSSTTRR